MISILVVVPTFENISTECFESLWALSHQMDVFVPEFKSIKGYDCARARNEAVKYFLDCPQYSHLFFVDSDIVLPKFNFQVNAFYTKELLTNEEAGDVILGWYPRKNNRTQSELFVYGYDRYASSTRWNCSELNKNPKEIIRVKGGGLGCAFISREVLKNLEFPWFKYELRDDDTYISEDLYFCNKVNDAGFVITANTTLKCSHVGKTIITA